MKRFYPYIFLFILAFGCEKSDLPFEDDIDAINPDPNPPQIVNAPCENGFAGTYPCNDYDLVAHLNFSDLSSAGVSGNDSWGWTDPSDGKEYALMCTSRGTIFIDISEANNPIVLGELRTHTQNSSWRDVKVYNNHAFIVSEAPGHGMQVFDLTRLRNVANAPETFTADAHYNGFGNAHNIVINEDTGFAYAVGTQTFSGGPHFVDIRNPKSPIAAGGYSVLGYTHDAQVITYNGPDSDHQGKELFIGSNGNFGGTNDVVIVDVTDKSSPQLISNTAYQNSRYAHQGWFTEDHRYFILGDELDEQGFGNNTRSIVFDFSDLDNPQFHLDYLGPTQAIDHNGYVKNGLFYLASYTAGVRIIDVSNLDNRQMTEVGFFDTSPNNDSASFDGVWNVYPFFESGNILVSDRDTGLYIIRKSPD